MKFLYSRNASRQNTRRVIAMRIMEPCPAVAMSRRLTEEPQAVSRPVNRSPKGLGWGTFTSRAFDSAEKDKSSRLYSREAGPRLCARPV